MCKRIFSGSIFVSMVALIAFQASAQNKAPSNTPAQPNAAGGGDQQAIAALKSAFVNAFNAGKADGIAATFAEDGRITDEEGASIEGRKAVTERYIDTFKDNPGAKIELHSKLLRFLSPDVAIEEGEAVVRDAEKPAISEPANQPAKAPQGAGTAQPALAPQQAAAPKQPVAPQQAAPQQPAVRQQAAPQQAAATQQPAAPQPVAAPETATSAYTAIFVKKDGRWLLSMLRDHPAPAGSSPTPHERLQELKWMVGDWVEEGPDAISTSSCKWDESGNFLIWKYKVQNRNANASGGTTYIGWDPLTKQITSWVFDSEGGHGEASWSRLADDQWMAKASGILADGRTASATQYIKQLGPDRASWTSLDRVAGGEPVPNISEYVLVRRPQQSSALGSTTPKGAGSNATAEAAVVAGTTERK